MSFLKNLRIGQVIPRIIAIAFVLDILSRFIVLDWVSFRAWEALFRDHVPCGSFRANAHYENTLSYGDLSAMGNMPQYREYRKEVFSTDAFGFRMNSNTASPQKYGALLVGDSMAVGSGVSDNETLSARLEQHLVTGVYNAASSDHDPPTLDRILSLARRLNIVKGTVFYESMERTDLPRRNQLIDEFASKDGHLSCHDWKSRLAIHYEGFVRTSPLRIVARKVFRKLENDFILPNVSKSDVVIKTLKNGDPMLFYPADIQSAQRNRSVDVSGFEALATELKKHGLKLVIILVPHKYTVYRSLLKDEDVAEGDSSLYLDVVERSLKDAGIPAVNLVKLFQQKAREYHQKNLYIYWRDDTHWNARGIELAAEEMQKQMDLLAREPAPKLTSVRPR